MAGLEDFDIFDGEAANPPAAEVPDVAEIQPPAAANGGGGRLNWTPLMSALVLTKFADIVGQGTRGDRGFKEVHVNAVAKELQGFLNQPVTGTQVYNHLRKWRTKWVRICKLKDLSGANWDEDLCMITLDPEHYKGHVKDHKQDSELLNTPIVNYQQMQTIFGCGVATGRFAMGSNEPLGQPPAEQEAIDVDKDAPSVGKDDKGKQKVDDKTKMEDKTGGKRKRGMSEEDVVLLTGVTDAIWSLGAAVSEGNHNEAAPGIYEAVMGCTGLSRQNRMICLNYLMSNKGPAMTFVGFSLEDKELWCRTHLGLQVDYDD